MSITISGDMILLLIYIFAILFLLAWLKLSKRAREFMMIEEGHDTSFCAFLVFCPLIHLFVPFLFLSSYIQPIWDWIVEWLRK